MIENGDMLSRTADDFDTKDEMARNKGFPILAALLVLIMLTGLLTACARETYRLPHSIYYLSGSPGNYQVWRMEANGMTVTRLTDEPLGVDRFSVSRADGSLAFISSNQLFLVDAHGQNRRLVADGSKAPADPFRGVVSSPVFSPDGRTLAYAFDGLHLYDVPRGEDEHVLTNLGNLLGETFVFDKEDYSPGPWSPDGSRLLVVMSYYEGSTLAVMEPGKDQPFTRLRSSGPVCCTYHWTRDGRSVLVANPSFGTSPPGLWRYDAETGEEFELVATLPGQSRYVGWPVQLRSGDLRFFYGERFSPDEGIPLVLVQSGPDGQDRKQLRPEEFHPGDVLWSEDGSMAIVHTFLGERSSENRVEQLILVRPDGRPLYVLLEVKDIQQIAWGP